MREQLEDANVWLAELPANQFNGFSNLFRTDASSLVPLISLLPDIDSHICIHTVNLLGKPIRRFEMVLIAMWKYQLWCPVAVDRYLIGDVWPDCCVGLRLFLFLRPEDVHIDFNCLPSLE